MHLTLIPGNTRSERLAWLETHANELHARLPYYPVTAALPPMITVQGGRDTDPFNEGHMVQLIDWLTQPAPDATTTKLERDLKLPFQLDYRRIPTVAIEWADDPSAANQLVSFAEGSPWKLTLYRRTNWPVERTPASIHLVYVQAFLVGFFQILLLEAWRGGTVFSLPDNPNTRVFGFTCIQDYVDQALAAPTFPGVAEIRQRFGYDIMHLRDPRQAVREAAHTLKAFVLGWEFQGTTLAPSTPPVIKREYNNGWMLLKHPNRLFAQRFELFEAWCELFLNYKLCTNV